MSFIEILPSEQQLRQVVEKTPKYMRPTPLPFAVVWHGGLEDHICDAIIERYEQEQPFQFPGCDALTRECPLPLDSVLDPVSHFVKEMNLIWWKYDIDEDAAAYMQAYEAGEGYKMHTDSALGQTRKLTAVVMLSDPKNYKGGQLRLIPYPDVFRITSVRGTIVIFPSWTLHDVTPVETGKRQTINMGFWGPQFK